MYTVSLTERLVLPWSEESYNRLVRHLQGVPFNNEDRFCGPLPFDYPGPVPVALIARVAGLETAILALRQVDGSERDVRLLSVWAARRVQKWIADPRCAVVLDTAEHHAWGRVSFADLQWAAQGVSPGEWDLAGKAALCTVRETTMGLLDVFNSAEHAVCQHAPKTQIEFSCYVEMNKERRAHVDMMARLCDGCAPWQSGPHVLNYVKE